MAIVWSPSRGLGSQARDRVGLFLPETVREDPSTDAHRPAADQRLAPRSGSVAYGFSARGVGNLSPRFLKKGHPRRRHR
jgi:hypothetical protein